MVFEKADNEEFFKEGVRLVIKRVSNWYITVFEKADNEIKRTPSRRRAWIKRESTDQRGEETRDKNKGDGGDIRLWQSV